MNKIIKFLLLAGLIAGGSYYYFIFVKVAPELEITLEYSPVSEDGILTPIGVIDEVNKFSLKLGRREQDIDSLKVYNFSQPANITVKLFGVDAHSNEIHFYKKDKEIFSVTQYDHTNVAIFAADPLNFIQKSGHTIMIHPGQDNFDPAVIMFRESLIIKNL